MANLFRWHRAPDWTPEAHTAADEYEAASTALAQARTPGALSAAYDLFAVAQSEFGEAMLALDKRRRPELYASAEAAPQTTVSSGLSTITKDWCETMARAECGDEIGAGSPNHPLRTLPEQTTVSSGEPTAPQEAQPKVEIKEIPNSDDCGNWFVFVSGVMEPTPYWSEAEAHSAILDKRISTILSDDSAVTDADRADIKLFNQAIDAGKHRVAVASGVSQAQPKAGVNITSQELREAAERCLEYPEDSSDYLLSAAATIDALTPAVEADRNKVIEECIAEIDAEAAEHEYEIDRLRYRSMKLRLRALKQQESG